MVTRGQQAFHPIPFRRLPWEPLGMTIQDISRQSQTTLAGQPQFVCPEIPIVPNDTLHQAIKLIDPDDLLVPGTHPYDSIRGMLQTWLDQHGPAETLEMARDSAKFLKTWWKVL